MLAKRTIHGENDLARGMTECGLEVWRLMASRGITTQRGLSRAILKRTGEQVSFDAVRNYLHGRSAIPSTFPTQVAKALNLDEEEMNSLARAFAFGQDTMPEYPKSRAS